MFINLYFICNRYLHVQRVLFQRRSKKNSKEFCGLFSMEEGNAQNWPFFEHLRANSPLIWIVSLVMYSRPVSQHKDVSFDGLVTRTCPQDFYESLRGWRERGQNLQKGRLSLLEISYNFGPPARSRFLKNVWHTCGVTWSPAVRQPRSSEHGKIVR